MKGRNLLKKYILQALIAGEVLRGDRISNTRYSVKMAEAMGCTVLCSKENEPVVFKKDESKMVAKFIKQEYNVHL